MLKIVKKILTYLLIYLFLWEQKKTKNISKKLHMKKINFENLYCFGFNPLFYNNSINGFYTVYCYENLLIEIYSN